MNSKVLTEIQTKADTLDLIKAGLPKNERFNVISKWVCDEHRAFVNEVGYPYLKQVLAYIIKKHDLVLDKAQEDDLRTLIYNASGYNREQDEKAQGWIMPDSEWLKAHKGKFIEMKSEGLLGSSMLKMKVIECDGQYYYMKPKAKRKGIPACFNKVRELDAMK